MNRADVQEARSLAAKFVEQCDSLLSEKAQSYDSNTGGYVKSAWRTTYEIMGKQTGAHRRLSLDLTRALARMRSGA